MRNLWCSDLVVSLLVGGILALSDWGRRRLRTQWRVISRIRLRLRTRTIYQWRVSIHRYGSEIDKWMVHWGSFCRFALSVSEIRNSLSPEWWAISRPLCRLDILMCLCGSNGRLSSGVSLRREDGWRDLIVTSMWLFLYDWTRWSLRSTDVGHRYRLVKQWVGLAMVNNVTSLACKVNLVTHNPRRLWVIWLKMSLHRSKLGSIQFLFLFLLALHETSKPISWSISFRYTLMTTAERLIWSHDLIEWDWWLTQWLIWRFGTRFVIHVLINAGWCVCDSG